MRAQSFFMEPFHFKFVVFLLMLLFLEIFLINCVVVGLCLEAENSALLQLKKGFTTGKPGSWLPGTDCCSWEGVTCDESGRITGLDLRFQFITGTIDPSLFNLTSLETLSFSANDFNGIPIPYSGWDRLVNLSTLDLSSTIISPPATISRLTKLTSLDLSSSFDHSIFITPMILQNMSNLKELILDDVNVSSYMDEWCGILVNSTPALELLSMVNCFLFGAICSSLPMLPFLSIIDFSYNNLDHIPFSFANFSSLSMLCLRENNLKGFFPNQIFQLKNLKDLEISDNPMLSGYLPDFLEYNNLNHLWVSNTNISGNLPDSIGNLKLLTDLDFSSCKFYGTIPSSIRNLSKLEYLDLSHNNFKGVVELEFIKDLKNLTYLDFSESGFSLTQPDAYIGSSSPLFPKISDLILVGCKLTKIPTFIKHQDQMDKLDLSNNKIHGKIPSWLWRKGGIKYLSRLSLANNNLTGEISPFICNLTGLIMLDLSNNKLTGTVPPCLLEGIHLKVLSLGGNRLCGAIPHGISPTCGLLIINLKENQLEGLLPMSLSNCLALEILDLGNNKLKDTFPYWLGNMPSLKILDLRSNMLYGLIGPPNGSYETNYAFPKMHVFDISSNNFSGNLSAKCFSGFKLMMINDLENGTFFEPNFDLYEVTIMNKGQLMTIKNYYSTLAMSIDLSNNHFEGEIPSIIGQFVYLQILNMSQNYLTGEIPTKLGNLVRLESLDLSRNNLYGKIPHEFVSLHFLSYLNLSYNKLVGIVPQGSQLCSFTNTSFEGNKGLDWFSCNTTVLVANNTITLPPSLGGASPNNRSYMIVLGILFGVGFGGSMAVVLILDVMFCNKARRRSSRPSHG